MQFSLRSSDEETAYHSYERAKSYHHNYIQFTPVSNHCTFVSFLPHLSLPVNPTAETLVIRNI